MRIGITILMLCLAGAYTIFHSEELNIKNPDSSIRVMTKTQNTADSLEYMMNRQYRLKIMTHSADGHWAVIAKHYDRNKDTALIVNSGRNPSKPFTKIGMNQFQRFLKNSVLLSFGSGQAEHLELSTGKTIQYSQIQNVYALSETGHYALLNHEEQLRVFDISGKEMYVLEGVQNFPVSNGKDQWYGYKKNTTRYEVIDFTTDHPKVLYQTVHPIRRMNISDSQNYLVVIEADPLTSAENLVIIDPKTGKVFKPLDGLAKKGEYIAVNETGNLGTWLITAEHKVPADKKLEIWYGNDGNLNRHEQGFSSVRRYWSFDTQGSQLTVIPSDRFKNLMSTGNRNYLLAFNYGELQDYTSLLQNLPISLYHTQNKTWTKLDTVKNASVYLPKQGSTILYRSLNQNWTVANAENGFKHSLKETYLDNPYFTPDGKKIYFESDRGLYVYEVEKNTLKDLLIGTGHQVRIVNKKRNNQGSSFLNISTTVVVDKKPLLIEIKDRQLNTVSYVILNQGKAKTVVPATADFIREIYYSDQLERIWYTQENFNRPTEILTVESNNLRRRHIAESGKTDAEAKVLKSQMMNYTNSEGIPLKGVLYYPENFDPSKKYPMIVRIYEVQSHVANQYYISGYNDAIAFDLRVLLSKGYFVYLPDIVTGVQGTGLSALDCVDKSLDALRAIPSIDQTKIGLIGHSHGAYETNFIATHSNRFAAYISGAGNSNIVRSYFSYNYNFSSPFYWQYENGQYKMPGSFAANKELYFKNNPIHYVDQVNAPILLWAGKKDENIKWDQVMEFYIGLKRNKKQVIALFYPQQGHALGFGTAENKDLYARVLQWWDYFLKDKKDVDWIDHQIKKGTL
jgi:dipeptidyl aminopeptidase/acylaminoacyl peptidase